MENKTGEYIMSDDSNKHTPYHSTPQESEKKKRLPVYILIVVGLFLIALIVYMVADHKPDASDAPPDHPNPSAEPASPNNTTPATSEKSS